MCITYDVLGVQVRDTAAASSLSSSVSCPTPVLQVDFFGTSWDDPDNNIKCVTFFELSRSDLDS